MVGGESARGFGHCIAQTSPAISPALRRWTSFLRALIMAAALLLVVDTAHATTGTLTVAANVTLRGDHQGSIVVVADGVVLDCAGHTVRGPGTTGIVVDGRHRVTVRNCVITGFARGILLTEASRASVVGNTTDGNVEHGIVLESSSANRTAQNSASGNGAAGVLLHGRSDRNLVLANTLKANASDGIRVEGNSSGNVLQGNRSDGGGTGQFGFTVESGAADTMLQENVATNHRYFGYWINNVGPTVLRRNTAATNGELGFALNTVTGATLDGNTSTSNGGAGFSVYVSPGNTLEGNRALRNAGAGFDVSTASKNILRRNEAAENGGTGFEWWAAPETTLVENLSRGNASGYWAGRPSSRSVVRRNVASRNHSYGFVITSSDNVLEGNRALDNLAQDADGAGFVFSRSDRNVVHDNVANGNGRPVNGPGFLLDNSSSNELAGNAAFTNGLGGVSVTGTSGGNVLRHNRACENGSFDARDQSTGAGNTWVENAFCVADLLVRVGTGADWRVLRRAAGKQTELGQAQLVCMSESSPAPCPVGAAIFGAPFSGWSADRSAVPGAEWVWAPGVDGSSNGAELAAYTFVRSFDVPGRPTHGELSIAVDDFAEVFVNGRRVGSVGSVFDPSLAGAHAYLTTFDITALLRIGGNHIELRAKNGPASWSPYCSEVCTYAQNPAGVLAGAAIRYG